MRNRPLTSGQIAKFLDVAPRTVGKWIDSGRMTGYRLPSGNNAEGDRRVTISAYIEFCNKHRIPILHTEDPRNWITPTPPPNPPAAHAALDEAETRRAA